MAQFAVLYEKFCRTIVIIFTVHVAIVVHALMGAVVVGFFPLLQPHIILTEYGF